MLAETQRHELLHALGIDIYVRRERAAEKPLAAVKADGDGTPQPSALRLAIVCEVGADAARESRQHALVARALGIDAQQLERVPVAAGRLLQPLPEQRAWLVLGEPLARVLGAELTTPQQNASTIAVTQALPEAMASAASRRRFWQLLKPLARALRARAAG